MVFFLFFPTVYGIDDWLGFIYNEIILISTRPNEIQLTHEVEIV